MGLFGPWVSLVEGLTAGIGAGSVVSSADGITGEVRRSATAYVWLGFAPDIIRAGRAMVKPNPRARRPAGKVICKALERQRVSAGSGACR